MSSKRAAAFFDLDRTLIDVNSAVLFAKFERQSKRISNWQFWVTAANTVLYHFSLLDMEKAYDKALGHYRGVGENDLSARTAEFFDQHIRTRLQPGARQALDFHKTEGRPLVMLSTSTTYQAELASKAWGLDHWIANRFHLEEGRLVGTVVKPLVYGEGKVSYARSWAAEHQVDLKQSWFYSDSYSDVPMLEEVGHPVVVNPDPKLRAYAAKKRWSIADWRLA